jgi:hypothetical protein
VISGLVIGLMGDDEKNDDIIDLERIKYGQFVELLNVIRSKGLISAQERREFDKKWRIDPENRFYIIEELERIMEKHSEELMEKDILEE